MKQHIGYLPLTTNAILNAAKFWAQARRGGYQTAHNHAIDADVILAAQAETINGYDDAVIATTNVGDISRFVQADEWANIV